ncbi:MAG TPA: hypothetical protein VLK22_00430 [Candidatus Udaeobacter sp.]|nr:hypothetical protein [Candidatus Udaeobacter sp.]
MPLMSSRKKVMEEVGVLFVLYVAVGFTAEALSTGIRDSIGAMIAGKFDPTLPCRTNLWVVPVYALSATVGFSVLGALFPNFFRLPWRVRGLVYMLGIYCIEYVWAVLIRAVFGIEVWVYSDSEFSVLRYNNPNFFALWFLFGFVLEKIKTSVLPRLLR